MLVFGGVEATVHWGLKRNQQKLAKRLGPEIQMDDRLVS